MKTATSQRSMTWYYKKMKEDPKPRKMPCQWLTDLRETAWVKCTDGGYRVPGDAPIVSGENTGVFSAEIDDEIVEFYESISVIFGSDLQGMSPEQRIDFWKRNRFTDDKLFIETLRESGLEGKDLNDAILQSNYRSDRKIIAPLERSISDPSDSFGGYFGYVHNLPSSLIEFMNGHSIQLSDSITPKML